MNFTEWINGKIKESGLKKNFIAEKLGVNYQTFLSYTTGNREMPLKILVNISELLNFSLDELKQLEYN